MAIGIIIFVILVIFVLSGLKLLYQYERGVVFTLGKFTQVKDPGLKWIFPIVQSMRKVDIRIRTTDVPKQEAITKDNISVLVNAVVYFRVEKPADAIIKIEDFAYAVGQYTQTALRDVIGNSELDAVLTEREKIATAIREIVDKETSEWGVDISSIKIQEIEIPQQMKRAMAKQAEAEREKRTMIISAEGELKASENLRKAADNLSKSPAAIQLRTLQTLRDISPDPSQKIVLFLPSDVGNVIKKFTGK
ncbi:MAG: slipin family protein [Candidatus Woesearchaeota archaeon]|jgi:regulator of protease activity HflC (stomatin/prohibitin superfamily)